MMQCNINKLSLVQFLDKPRMASYNDMLSLFDHGQEQFKLNNKQEAEEIFNKVIQIGESHLLNNETSDLQNW